MARTTVPTESITATLVEILDRVGGGVTDGELKYQVERTGTSASNMMEDLIELESQGLVRSRLLFELTDAGRNASRG